MNPPTPRVAALVLAGAIADVINPGRVDSARERYALACAVADALYQPLAIAVINRLAAATTSITPPTTSRSSEVVRSPR